MQQTLLRFSNDTGNKEASHFERVGFISSLGNKSKGAVGLLLQISILKGIGET
jgi:hypothetical protein